MRHHATSVILLGGWLLLMPPPSAKSPSVDDTLAPFQSWMPLHAYDTAEAFEKDLAEDHKRVQQLGLPVGNQRCDPTENVYAPASQK